MATSLDPHHPYSSIEPTKSVPIVELKYSGKVINKIHHGMHTSAMRAVGRIDKQMDT